MRIRARSYWLPKKGNAAADYEDASWPVRMERDARVFRCAVADGATETSFSGEWARLLVRAYTRGWLSGSGWDEGLATAQRTWREEVGDRSLPWYAEEKLRQGAFSSLVGLTLASRARGTARWRAVSVGDSCLFQIRADRLVEALPLASSSEFGRSPHLLSTVPERNERLGAHIRRDAGDALPGDNFYLMTDAIACWFLGSIEDGGQPWTVLRCAFEAIPSRWECTIAELRAGDALRNDDVTALAVEVS